MVNSWNSHWRGAMVIAVCVNVSLFVVALTAQEGVSFLPIVLSNPGWITLCFLPHVAVAAITYLGGTWFSRKSTMPIVAPTTLLVVGVLGYGRLIFGGPLDPDTAQHMAVFLTAPMECLLLPFLLWCLRGRIGVLKRMQ